MFILLVFGDNFWGIIFRSEKWGIFWHFLFILSVEGLFGLVNQIINRDIQNLLYFLHQIDYVRKRESLVLDDFLRFVRSQIFQLRKSLWIILVNL